MSRKRKAPSWFDFQLEKKQNRQKHVMFSLQDLVEAVATYFQNLDPDTVVYVPKCDKDRFE